MQDQVVEVEHPGSAGSRVERLDAGSSGTSGGAGSSGMSPSIGPGSANNLTKWITRYNWK
jgi:hypothetical protein